MKQRDLKKLSRKELIRRIEELESGTRGGCPIHSHDLSTQQKLATIALSDSEERLRAILETAVETIITIDERGIIESMNLSGERIFGYKAGEVIGKNISMLMPEPYRREHDGYLDNYRRTGKARIIGIGREVAAQRKDGTIFPIELSVSEVRLADRRLYTGFIRDISERKRLEREILEVGEREQQRIGQDLHDGLCQQLAGIELMSQVLKQKLEARSKADAERVGEIARHVRDAISHTRLLARGLSPVTLESEGLMSALEELAGNTEKIFQISCRFNCPRPVLVSDQIMATHLFRIAQEAVSNAIKHGKATQILVQLKKDAGQVVLMITDNGGGFPRVLPKNKGMGLQIMQSRTGMIGGTLVAQNNPIGGATIICSVALNARPKQNGTARGRKNKNRKDQNAHPHRR